MDFARPLGPALIARQHCRGREQLLWATRTTKFHYAVEGFDELGLRKKNALVRGMGAVGRGVGGFVLTGVGEVLFGGDGDTGHDRPTRPDHLVFAPGPGSLAEQTVARLGEKVGQAGAVPGQFGGQTGPAAGQPGPAPGQAGPAPGQAGPVPAQLGGLPGVVAGRLWMLTTERLAVLGPRPQPPEPEPTPEARSLLGKAKGFGKGLAALGRDLAEIVTDTRRNYGNNTEGEPVALPEMITLAELPKQAIAAVQAVEQGKTPCLRVLLADGSGVDFPVGEAALLARVIELTNGAR